ncbi:MAG: hypothetical protein AB7O62_12345 [Pirellulales bacterium]
METKPTRTVPAANPLPGSGLGRDLGRLKADGSATVAELREFVHNLRGRPPGEVLGLVTESGLVRATATATFGTIVLMLLLTAGPYAWGQLFPPPAPPAKAEVAEEPAVKPEDDKAVSTPANADDETAQRGNAVLNKMGEDETRMSDPKSNPLEEMGDDLLKDIK